MYWPPAGGAGVQRPLKFATHSRARDRDARARAGRPEVDPPRRGAPGADAGMGAPRALRRAERKAPRRGAPRRGGVERATRPGGALRPPCARAGRERDVERDRDPRRDPDRPARGDRRRCHDVAAELGAPGRRRCASAPRASAGSRTSATRCRERGPHGERLAARAKEQPQETIAALIARYADSIVVVADAYADEIGSLNRAGRSYVANGADFDDFAGIDYHPNGRFRVTHRGRCSASATRGRSSPRSPSGLDVVARFVGDFRPADREWVESSSSASGSSSTPTSPRSQSLEFQRDSEALLLLIPRPGAGAGRDLGEGVRVPRGGTADPRAVPPDGAAADFSARPARAWSSRPTTSTRSRPRSRPARALDRRALDGTPLAPRSSAGSHRGRAPRSSPSCSGRRMGDALPLPRDDLLRHVREGALVGRRDVSSRTSSRSFLVVRGRPRRGGGPATAADVGCRARASGSSSARLPDRLLQPRHDAGDRAVRQGARKFVLHFVFLAAGIA